MVSSSIYTYQDSITRFIKVCEDAQVVGGLLDVGCDGTTIKGYDPLVIRKFCDVL
jgi:hypothetical protein